MFYNNCAQLQENAAFQKFVTEMGFVKNENSGVFILQPSPYYYKKMVTNLFRAVCKCESE